MGSDGDVNRGWTKIQSRRFKDKVRKTKDQVTMFFASNILRAEKKRALWKAFSKYGEATDNFMGVSSKKNGGIYGFVRFIGVVDPRSFEEVINGTLFLGSKLMVNISRFPRWEIEARNPSSGGGNPSCRYVVDVRLRDKRTFAEVVAPAAHPNRQNSYG